MTIAPRPRFHCFTIYTCSLLHWIKCPDWVLQHMNLNNIVDSTPFRSLSHSIWQLCPIELKNWSATTRRQLLPSKMKWTKSKITWLVLSNMSHHVDRVFPLPLGTGCALLVDQSISSPRRAEVHPEIKPIFGSGIASQVTADSHFPSQRSLVFSSAQSIHRKWPPWAATSWQGQAHEISTPAPVPGSQTGIISQEAKTSVSAIIS